MEKNFVRVSDIVNKETGKTLKEENLEKKHKYKIDDLLEIDCEDSEYHGMRLYVIGLVRDCDGTPLYVLGSKGMELYQQRSAITPVKENSLYNFNSFSGFGESILKLIKKA